MGREFIELFEEWSKSYDDTVDGHNLEYREVFLNYERILDSVVSRVHGHAIEFGIGTGNLTEKLLNAGLTVTAVEPSPAMREKAFEKLQHRTDIVDGDFFEFPKLENVDSIISTYAFHHLNDVEKTKAIAIYSQLLKTGGKIVFADTMYLTKEHHKQAILDAKSSGYHNLANDLSTEYYTTIPFLEDILKENGFTVSFDKCNSFVWIMEAEKL
ncbi:class I SAM-dependent DNA methyltransferase [Peribacillus loiseleuriae]|uniref:Uncharacterized methyltransferase AC625_16275 n=1 Tax=Peribacillus loiseleuriae TaxID=1679170 RepID=A0A0K9GW84_9BACI|nr:class I SAM-dependent methyltransferase [Peribacillus loiseleuriae]KMY50886.1 SAM-dependent methyltransferase [Peribacillus loiseleuriae]